MNTPVSFEIAKLLKEKGFDIVSVNCYSEERFKDKNTGGDLFTGVFRLCTKSRFHKRYYYAPTIAEVVMRVHKEKGLWINVMYMGFELKYSWSIDIVTTSGSEWDSYGEEGDICYKSPTEAYEAAIEYTLKNLI